MWSLLSKTIHTKNSWINKATVVLTLLESTNNMESRYQTSDSTNNYYCLKSHDQQAQGTQKDVTTLQSWMIFVKANTYIQTPLISFFVVCKKSSVCSYKHTVTFKTIYKWHGNTTSRTGFTTELLYPLKCRGLFLNWWFKVHLIHSDTKKSI
jgi:hypothetical protein